MESLLHIFLAWPSAKKDPTQEDSVLFKLPGEIRERIYEYAAASRVPVEVERIVRGANKNVVVWFNPRPPNLLFTCGRLYREMIGIYVRSRQSTNIETVVVLMIRVQWTENAFRFTEKSLRADALRAFRSCAGPWADQFRCGHVLIHMSLANVEVDLEFEVKVYNGMMLWRLNTQQVRARELPRAICTCAITRLARGWDGSVLEFIEVYSRRENILNGGAGNWNPCKDCKRPKLDTRLALAAAHFDCFRESSRLAKWKLR
jgi:hypothetical protein